jgi:5-hydroxyisourate hydrolase
MSSLSTHVLDAVSGAPAAGMAVSLEQRRDGTWSSLGGGVTDDDGRIRELAPSDLAPGTYRLTFDVDGSTAGRSPDGSPGFYPEVSIVFRITEERHHHVPLLLSPFAYSTYRGS